MFGLAFAATELGAAGGVDGGVAAYQRVMPLIESIKRDDTVVTAGGIHGRVVTVEADALIVDIANDVKVKVGKNFIAGVHKS